MEKGVTFGGSLFLGSTFHPIISSKVEIIDVQRYGYEWGGVNL